MNILIFHHVRQAVGAKQIDFVRQHFVFVDLDLDGRLNAEGAGNVISIGGALCFVVGLEAAIHEFLQQRMVERQLLERVAA